MKVCSDDDVGLTFFNSPGQSPGRAIALTPASASALASELVSASSFMFKEFLFSRPFDRFGSYLV